MAHQNLVYQKHYMGVCLVPIPTPPTSTRWISSSCCFSGCWCQYWMSIQRYVTSMTMDIFGKGCVEYNVQYMALINAESCWVLAHNANNRWGTLEISMHEENFQIGTKSVGGQINIDLLGKNHCTFWIYFFNRSKIIVPIMLLKYSQGEV